MSQIPTLRELNLGGNNWVNDEALALIPNTTIEALSLSCCEKITGYGLKTLNGSQVSSLDLFGCQHLTDEELSCLPLQIERLDIRKCVGLGIEAMKSISKMKELRHLVLANVNMNNEMISLLPRQLLSLNLSCRGLPDTAYVAIGEMQSLVELSLRG